MSELVERNDNTNPESYSPKKPLIINMVKKIAETSTNIPAIEIYQVHREPFQVLGIENKFSNDNRDPNCGGCWGEFFNGGNHDKIKPYLTEGPLLGLFCQSDPGYYNYLIGGIVNGVKEAPEGMFLSDFQESDFILVTHEWEKSIDEAEMNVGRIVGYAHGNELQLPDGYIIYNGPPSPIMFIERYNYEFENNRFRFEVWLPIRKNA